MNLSDLKFAGIGTLALLAAGCGGAAAYGGGNAAQSASAVKSPSGYTIRAKTSPLGQIIVDSRGRTVYLFEKDSHGSSTCYGACAGIWPPLTTTSTPKATGGLTAQVGTVKRTDGTMQVTYNGHPLYYYAGDTASGQTKGEGLDQFGAAWDVLSPAGNKVAGGAGTGGSGGGY